MTAQQKQTMWRAVLTALLVAVMAFGGSEVWATKADASDVRELERTIKADAALAKQERDSLFRATRVNQYLICELVRAHGRTDSFCNGVRP